MIPDTSKTLKRTKFCFSRNWLWLYYLLASPKMLVVAGSIGNAATRNRRCYIN